MRAENHRRTFEFPIITRPISSTYQRHIRHPLFLAIISSLASSRRQPNENKARASHWTIGRVKVPTRPRAENRKIIRVLHLLRAGSMWRRPVSLAAVASLPNVSNFIYRVPRSSSPNADAPHAPVIWPVIDFWRLVSCGARSFLSDCRYGNWRARCRFFSLFSILVYLFSGLMSVCYGGLTRSMAARHRRWFLKRYFENVEFF